ncbi:hypothetical protein ACFFQF_22520 [Haladaptatus pallidirubidus]|uniref:ABC transporter permease subunit n=1 Tax=Haladaptatus pallidirubidus TaxID=1008152 RepID=UPI0035E62128
MPTNELILQTFVNGLLLGGIYAVAALGLSLVFGIMDIVNLAHGHMLMIGGYVAIVLFTAVGITPLVGMVVAIGLMFVLGMALQKFCSSTSSIRDSNSQSSCCSDWPSCCRTLGSISSAVIPNQRISGFPGAA